MASITRAEVAARVDEKLDKLASDLSTAASGGRAEGDYTYPLDDALRDCGFDAITDADTHAKIRAVLLGTEYHAAQRLFWRRSVDVSNRTASQSVEWNTLLSVIRKRLEDLRGEYGEALAAIGRRLDSDAEAASVAGVLEIDDADDLTRELADSGLDTGLPWFEEGYHEVGD